MGRSSSGPREWSLQQEGLVEFRKSLILKMPAPHDKLKATRNYESPES